MPILWQFVTVRLVYISKKTKALQGILKMADSKKEQERAELHRAIWNIANDLRGSIDGWDFKQYVLGMLFYRYISENLTNYINQSERESGNKDFNYADLSGKEAK